ncbi:MAG: CDGSH iron-sulfur domain-containing protein [Thiohalomonadaceae bacterium]
MSEAVVAKKGPFVVELEPGDYWYCTCGRSASQPFCDGSHKGTGLAPTKFTVSEKKEYGLCGCKRSAGAPFCDGTHKGL